MTDQQMSLFAAPSSGYTDRAPSRPSYVRQGQERPADIPKLERSAKTMEARVLAWFAGQTCPTLPPSLWAATPSDCAKALGLELTTVRPRISVLTNRPFFPRLERCTWIKRRPTVTGSEGFYRYAGGEIR